MSFFAWLQGTHSIELGVSSQTEIQSLQTLALSVSEEVLSSLDPRMAVLLAFTQSTMHSRFSIQAIRKLARGYADGIEIQNRRLLLSQLVVQPTIKVVTYEKSAHLREKKNTYRVCMSIVFRHGPEIHFGIWLRQQEHTYRVFRYRKIAGYKDACSQSIYLEV